MHILQRRLLAAMTCIATSLAARAATDVHMVAADGSGDFTQIQAAVDAAVNDDVILIRGDTYDGFTVQNKSLWIARLGANEVVVQGTVTVEDLGTQRRVVLSGLKVDLGVLSGSEPTLRVLDNQGHVHATDCAFFGRRGVDYATGPNNDGAAAADLQRNRAVVFSRCTFLGGTGGESCLANGCVGGVGGVGVVTDMCAPAFYDCRLTGGAGGFGLGGGSGGLGGTGCRVKSRVLFASRTWMLGGPGGDVDESSGASPGGNGGDGLFVAVGALARMLESVINGGGGGFSELGPSGNGGQESSGGGTIVDLEDFGRLLTAKLIAPQSSLVQIEVAGVQGDRVVVGSSLSPDFVTVPALLGIDLLAPLVRYERHWLGTIPESGLLTVEVPMLAIGMQPMRPRFLQAKILDAAGHVVLSGPAHILVTNCALLAPDCNGNGNWDVCDLADGTSVDSNGNELPDECEFTQVTHVDAGAAPGGDGSALAPFQTLAEGVAASPDYQIVRVHDGVYTGPQNRDLDLSDRVLRIESANGPTNCIVDLQSAGILCGFFFRQGNEAARIAGFTIRNGNSAASQLNPAARAGGIMIRESSPTIENCIFENCQGSEAGAIHARESKSLIRGCTFVENHSSASGGGVYLSAASLPVSGAARLFDCRFFDNSAGQSGGAAVLRSSSDNEVHMSHCDVLSNSANSGGGISITPSFGVSQAVRVDDCMIAGNSAPSGGGIGLLATTMGLAQCFVQNCTIVGNNATAHGGGAYGSGRLQNCVVWGNSAPQGAQLAIVGSGRVLDVRRCDAEGGQAAVYVDPGAVLTWGAGNIDQDPLFVDADGADDVATTFGDNNYRLASGSPCIDAGDNAFVPLDVFDLDGDANTIEPIPFDLDFFSRFIDDLFAPDTGAGAPPIVDIGAYESQP